MSMLASKPQLCFITALASFQFIKKKLPMLVWNNELPISERIFKAWLVVRNITLKIQKNKQNFTSF